VTSFGLVVLLGYLIGGTADLGQPQTVIAVKVEGAAELPKELVNLPVEIRGGADHDGLASGQIDSSGRYTNDLPVADRIVCVELPAGWVIARPATRMLLLASGQKLTCTSTPIQGPAPNDVQLTVAEGVVVNATATGSTVTAEELSDAVAELVENGKVIDSEPLDAGGRATVTANGAANALACLKPPPGWRVLTDQPSTADGSACMKPVAGEQSFALGKRAPK